MNDNDERDRPQQETMMMNRMSLESASEIEAVTVDDAQREKSAAPATGRGRTTTVKRIIVILFLMAIAASGTRAQSLVSITASPLHLSQSIVQVTGELRLIDNVSVAGVAGLGRHDGASVWTGGGQIRVYLMGGFDNGLHVGAEALYSELGSARSVEGIVDIMSGAALGPFVGYKLVLPIGLTFDLQGGFRYGEETEESSTLGPLANVNVGWSF